jgi:uncharacterized membrane protein
MKLRSNLLAGLLVILPIWAVFWLLKIAVGYFWGIYAYIATHVFNLSDLPFWMDILLTLAGFASTVALLALLGLFSRLIIGQQILVVLRKLFIRIPIFGAVYSTLDQLLRTLLSDQGSKQFRRVVYIEYPRKGVWAVAFVTGNVKNQHISEKYLNVFIPTVPNPTSGFHLIVDESEVKETHLKVEDAFKLILSLGMAQPEVKPKA